MTPSFKTYIKECMEGVPVTTWDPQFIHLNVSSDRDALNDQLADLTDREILHPEVVYEQVCEYLETHGIQLPFATVYTDQFLETAGELILPLVAEDAEEVLYLYFAFCQDDETQIYDVLAEIMTESELEETLDENTDIGVV